jgi:hypothetical protein
MYSLVAFNLLKIIIKSLQRGKSATWIAEAGKATD